MPPKAGAKHSSRRKPSLGAFLEENGLTLYEPDLAAFRSHVQEQYKGSEFAASWPEGVLDKINALGN